MTSELLIGQALITGHGSDEPGGYMLRAASPSVTAEDREQLEVAPQISDFLHLEEQPGAYVSFHRLPSGSFAFGRRFARGRWRRGTFNRIVAWTLVVPEPVLEALAWEPWLLPTCSFRPAGEMAVFTYRQLIEQETEWAGVDLAVTPPDNPEVQRLAFLEPRIGFLRDQWGRETLERELGRALSVFESGGRLLLPQGAQHEQLTALAWSALPRRDRREIAWTTHLAPGSGEVFRLANVPLPEDARHGLGSIRAWSLLGDVALRAGARALVEALVDRRPPFSQVSRDWYEVGGGLAANGERVRRWVRYVQDGAGKDLREGLPNLEDLAVYLDSQAIDATAATDPWRGPGVLLRLCAMTVRNLICAQTSRDQAATEVFQLLKRRGLNETILNAELLYALANEEQDGEVILGALAMALRATSNAGPTAAALLAATEPLERRGDRTLLGHIAERFVVPRLGGSPPPPLATVLREHLALFLAALRVAPAGLAAALRGWKDELFDRALQELAAWAEHDRDAARQVAREVAAGDIELPARASLQGISGRLEAARVPLEDRFPFLLAEAALVDSENLPTDASKFRVDLARLDSDKQCAVALRLCRQLRKAPRLGAAHRELASQMAGALALCPDDAVAALVLDREDISAAELQAWKNPIDAIAVACQERGYKDQSLALRANWRRQDKRWSGPEVGSEIHARPSGLEPKARVSRRASPSLRSSSDVARQRASSTGRQIVGGSALEDEVLRLADEARVGILSHDDFAAICSEILPDDAVPRLKTLLGILLSFELLPSARLLLKDHLLKKALKRAKPEIFSALPRAGRVAWLAHDGALLLRVAEALGEDWGSSPVDCFDFLGEAIQLDRFDAVGAFLRGTDRPDGRSFLDALAALDGRPELLQELVRACRQEVHRWSLIAFCSRIIQLGTEREER